MSRGLGDVYKRQVELSPEATHYWETEMVDLDLNGELEFVALENNQFHVEDSTFVISIYQRNSDGGGFSLAPDQPPETGATHDQNFQFLDLDLDGDLDIVSTLKPSESSHGNTIAFHENLNPGWSLSMKGFNALFQDYNCLLYTSPSPRDKRQSRMPSSA